MVKGKQSVADLAFTDKDWTRTLPKGCEVRLRMEAVTPTPHQTERGVTVCTDLQWHLGGRYIATAMGSALMMTQDGIEVPGVFK